jgi:oxygen-independent coproporphyrinogen-3 oxidase
VLDPADLTLEFALNAMRLNDGVPTSLFSARTGLRLTRITQAADAARSDGLLDPDPDQLRPTALGRRFLNDLVRYFDHD